MKETSSNPTSGREGTYKEVRNGDFTTHDSTFVRLNILFLLLFYSFNGFIIHFFKHRFVCFILRTQDLSPTGLFNGELTNGVKNDCRNVGYR